MKSSFDELFSVEEDIFDECSLGCTQMRKTIVEGLSNSAQKLEEFTILEVPSQILFEVVM